MPRDRDIAGRRFGALLAVEPLAERDGAGRVRWRMRCDCGAGEVATTHDVFRRDGAIEACRTCRRRSCAICGAALPDGATGRTRTCEGECRAELKRRQTRAAATRRAADPNRQALFLARVRADRADPEKGAVVRATDARKRARARAARAADPALADAQLEVHRASRARVQLRRLVADGAALAAAGMTTEALRAELAAALTVTAANLAHVATVWRELERRGEDLSGVRTGLKAYLPLIATEAIRAELVVRYAGHLTLLRRLARLPLADQDRLLADDRVTVVEERSGELVEVLKPLSRLTGPQVGQVIRDDIVDVEAQRRALSGERARAEPVYRRVSVSLAESEIETLRKNARLRGISVERLVLEALGAVGLLSVSETGVDENTSQQG